jgi:proton-dependent oligopeptide transporter, POT family
LIFSTLLLYNALLDVKSFWQNPPLTAKLLQHGEYAKAHLRESIMTNKQPRALKIFFFTEMWERYGFYAIQTLLVFYFIRTFHLTDQLSYSILGSITALAYGNSVLGGYIADRLLGHRMSVLLGATLLAMGYALAAISFELTFSLWAFAIITVGTGLLKPSISSMVGLLYEKKDIRRCSGYTIFYVGLSLGIILGETLAGFIQRYFDWHSMFFSASFMMIIAFLIFWLGTRRFKITDDARSKEDIFLAAIFVSLTILVSYYIISHQATAVIFFAVAAIVCGFIIFYEAYQEKGSVRKKLIAFLILMGLSICFWTLYYQMFFSMNLFIARVVDRHLWGMTLLPTVYPAVEAGAGILIGLFLGWFWHWLESNHKHWNPSPPMKFTLAFLFHSIALGIFYLSSLLLGENTMIMPGRLLISYLFIALAELLLTPIGLAMVGELVPKRLMGLMMGVFLVTMGLGGKLAGILANFSTVPHDLLTDFIAVEHIYQHSFLIYFIFSLVVTGLSFSLVPLLKRLIYSE